ncbi:fructokinase [Burkholderia pseudomallei]|nr:fructokinase [Burkholderia pseudomallei]OMV04655.1 fructokinase [Burkholderia pseudomallei]OMV07935.1 fructokinase [Burkholderia pseudomallei]OMW54922.1 fructokinase [Burkholderia pseudomallei]OMW65312.1 fructokinase [Burkholderia pseudomallei]
MRRCVHAPSGRSTGRPVAGGCREPRSELRDGARRMPCAQALIDGVTRGLARTDAMP